MRLYEIDENIMRAYEKAIDPETGEIKEEKAFEELNDLQMLREKKIESILLWIKDLSAEVEALKKEKMSFEKRQKSTNNRIESLKRYVSSALNGEKFMTERVEVTWIKSTAVEYIGDVYSLPEQCISRKDPEVNKTELKKLLAAGAKIPGAALVTRNNIQIK